MECLGPFYRGWGILWPPAPPGAQQWKLTSTEGGEMGSSPTGVNCDLLQ